MCNCVSSIAKKLFLAANRKSQVELMIAVVGNAIEIKFVGKYTGICFFEQQVVWIYC